MTYQEGQGHCPTCGATWGPITAYTCDGPNDARHPRVRTVPGPPPGELADGVQRVGEVMRAELADDAPLFVYGPPDLEEHVRAALEVLPGVRGFLSRAVPPGRLHVTAVLLDDPTAREVTP